MELILIFIYILYKFNDTTFVMKAFLFSSTFIIEINTDTFI